MFNSATYGNKDHMNIWTTDLTVSQRIKELIGEQGHIGFTFNWMFLPRIGEWTVQHHTDNTNFSANVLTRDEWVAACATMVPTVTLSELAPVLKKIGEKLGKEDNEENQHGKLVVGVDDIITYKQWWYIQYLKCCELVATGGDANAYLTELLK